jgi:hypothetical protein
MKNYAKRILRPVLRPLASKIRNLVDGEDVDPKSLLTKNDTVYPWLNWILDTAIRESRGVLRPNYTWSVLHAAHLAKSLGLSRISVAEFGVAGGNGLLALERAADLAQEKIGIGVDVYGFDTGKGLPPPRDHRDLPNLYSESAYRMDVDALRKRLTRAELVLGLIEETVPKFLASKPAPIGFMSIDVDYYSSTLDVFKIFDDGHDALMPRIHCYFDDTMGFTFSEYTGERLAIAEFNKTHEMRKISPIFGLKYFLKEPYSNQTWCDQMFIAHIFDHELYGRADGLNVRVNNGHTALANVSLILASLFSEVMALIPVETVIGSVV